MIPFSAVLDRVDVNVVSLNAISVTVSDCISTLLPEFVARTVIRETSDGSHFKKSPGAVQVKVTVSIGHGLSTLTEY